MSNLSLEVGKFYWGRFGKIHKIERSKIISLNGGDGMEVFITEDNLIFTADGQAISDFYDLTEEAETTMVVNEKSYGFLNHKLPDLVETNAPPFSLTVYAVLDRVPGTWDDPMDLMKWIAENPYVRQVRLNPIIQKARLTVSD